MLIPFMSMVFRIRVEGLSPNYWKIFDEYLRANKPFISYGEACVTTDGFKWPVFNSWLNTHADGGQELDYKGIADKYGEGVNMHDCN